MFITVFLFFITFSITDFKGVVSKTFPIFLQLIRSERDSFFLNVDCLDYLRADVTVLLKRKYFNLFGQDNSLKLSEKTSNLSLPKQEEEDYFKVSQTYCAVVAFRVVFWINQILGLIDLKRLNRDKIYFSTKDPIRLFIRSIYQK